MKKKLIAIMATGICAAAVLIAGPVAAHFSANAYSEDVSYNCGGTCIHADADKDHNCGVCGKDFVDADGDGVCDNRGSGQRHNECDKNCGVEDGVCDNRGSGHYHGGHGSHGGHGNGSHGGCNK